MQKIENEHIAPFCSSDKMRHLIKADTSLLMVLNRFGICLGFGEKTVKEVCTEQHIDTDTFLCVANYICGRSFDFSRLSLKSLIITTIGNARRMQTAL